MKQAQYSYTRTLPTHLVDEWSWFEARGYLPVMPDTLVGARTLGIQEHDACVDLKNEIISFLQKIV